MREGGVDPVATRQTLRAELMKQAVIQQEVDRKLFFGWTMDELKKYFAENQDKFRKPESVTISEIFLSSAGKNEAEVKARALELVSTIAGRRQTSPRLPAANSEREQNGVRIAPQTGGKVGTFEVPNLREDIANSVKPVQIGGISEPLRTNDGYQIFRVDARTAASSAATFNENQMREAMTMERGTKAREDYLQGLRNDAYIKISENYRAGVAPLLKLPPETIAENSDSSTAKSPKRRRASCSESSPDRRTRRSSEQEQSRSRAGRKNVAPAPAPADCPYPGMRLDLFLKASRLSGRRTLAQKLCDADRVSINGNVAKSSHVVKVGDEISHPPS